MTIPTGETTASTAPGSTVVRESSSELLTGPGHFLVPAIPALATFVITLWRITGSSYWRDEAATMVAVHRSFGQLLRLLGQTDAVHGVYYVMMWGIVRATGSGELAARLPSVLAMTAAAALVAVIGRRLVSPQAGLAAGLVFAVVPATSLYAQNARPDAMAVALAAGASYLLVRVLDDGAASRRWLAGYAVCIAVLGLIDLFALLLVVAHAVAVAAAAIRTKDHGARRALVLRWLIAVVVALAIISPLAWLAFTERAAIQWIKAPDSKVWRGLAGLVAPAPHPRAFGNSSASVLAALGVLIGAGLVVSMASGRAALHRHWPSRLAEICLPWLILPAAILLGISLVKPIYNVRYILFSMPALALLSGAALAALGRIAGTAALAVVALVCLPVQLAVRHPAGHGENIRKADQIVAAYMRPGDAVIFHNPTEESWSFAYPYGLAQLKDIGQAQTPAMSGTLTGTSLPAAVVQQRLSLLPRVWVVDLKYLSSGTAPQLHNSAFQLVRHWRVDDIQLFLYTRRSGA
ncbi:MAG TPA: glycosyltransferase family 39 protein [Streptosporangiaceae bacterium]|nr:glycosyltransferase family 39 protein [Streptosporangiaceae bacterium]